MRPEAPARLRSFLFLTVSCSLAGFAGSTTARPDGNRAEDTAFFESQIRPILVENCYECHSEAESAQKGGLLLDREVGWLEGGDSGKAVVPGNVEASLLITAVRRLDEDTAMPPKHPLGEREVKLLEAWIRRGAPGPDQDMGETEFSRLGDQDYFFEKAREHWAFQPVDPSLAPGTGHPVDAFIAAKRSEQGLAASPRASRPVLVRRLSYDLTGLPPSEESLSLAPEALIDSLLASPRFGEHFARLWLDLARYAETANTYRADTKTPHYYPYAFTYRDYVVDAFNTDKPFDDFIREQLAADLMGFAEDAPELAALGFLGVSPIRNMSHDYVDDAIDTTTRGFLGLTVACSRCHDHKFEPIPTADYYSLYGVFNSIERPEPWKLDAFPLISGYQPSVEQVDDYEVKRAEIEKEIQEAGNKKRGGNNRSVADTIRQTSLAQLLITHDGAPVRAMAVSEKKRPVQASIFLRGNPGTRGESVPRRFLQVLDPDQVAFDETNSGRLDLANRIADPENPLTARVLVNRVWGALMGGHLVDTPSDFGLQGSAPSHPALLDWLAADFVSHGWSLKHLVRTIVTSETYAQQSTLTAELAEQDPENRWYARANAKRLEVEELRDSLLALSGRLDDRMRGRSGPLWGDDYTRRRSLYGYINRFNLDPTLRAFDFPSPNQTQEKRTESIVAPQALFTMNAPFVIDQADALIGRLALSGEMTEAEKVDQVFQAIFQRAAAPPEQERIARFLEIETEREVDPWPLLAQALFMSNEFLYVD